MSIGCLGSACALSVAVPLLTNDAERGIAFRGCVKFALCWTQGRASGSRHSPTGPVVQAAGFCYLLITMPMTCNSTDRGTEPTTRRQMWGFGGAGHIAGRADYRRRRRVHTDGDARACAVSATTDYTVRVLGTCFSGRRLYNSASYTVIEPPRHLSEASGICGILLWIRLCGLPLHQPKWHFGVLPFLCVCVCATFPTQVPQHQKIDLHRLMRRMWTGEMSRKIW